MKLHWTEQKLYRCHNHKTNGKGKRKCKPFIRSGALFAVELLSMKQCQKGSVDTNAIKQQSLSAHGEYLQLILMRDK